MKRRIMRRSIAAFGCAVALTAAVGCAGDDDESAGDVAQAYADASNRRDSAEICDLYSDELKRSLAIEANCEGFVEEQSSGGPPADLRVVEVNEEDDRATAELETTGESGGAVPLTITLERQDGDWRITSLGPSAD